MIWSDVWSHTNTYILAFKFPCTCLCHMSDAVMIQDSMYVFISYIGCRPDSRFNVRAYIIYLMQSWFKLQCTCLCHMSDAVLIQAVNVPAYVICLMQSWFRLQCTCLCHMSNAILIQASMYLLVSYVWCCPDSGFNAPACVIRLTQFWWQLIDICHIKNVILKTGYHCIFNYI